MGGEEAYDLIPRAPSPSSPLRPLAAAPLSEAPLSSPLSPPRRRELIAVAPREPVLREYERGVIFRLGRLIAEVVPRGDEAGWMIRHQGRLILRALPKLQVLPSRFLILALFGNDESRTTIVRGPHLTFFHCWHQSHAPFPFCSRSNPAL